MQINSNLHNLDFAEYNKIFTETGAVTIPHFLNEDVANNLHQFFSSEMPNDWWSAATYPQENDPNISYIRNLPENVVEINSKLEYANREFFHNCLSPGNSGSLAYHFYRTLGNHVDGCWCTECKFREWLLSDELLSFMENISGERYTSYNTMFASKYTEGCFLSPHTDHSNGDIGFVYQLTKDWKPQWGGLLNFMDDSGKMITSVEVPTFNSLTLFHLPGGSGKWHYVSHVNPGVEAARLAYTGWFKK